MVHYSKPFPIFDTLNLFNVLPIKTVLPTRAKHDQEAALDFLKQYNNKKTRIMYSREVERLLLWAWLIVKKSVLDLNDQDIQKYIKFRLDLPASWISVHKQSRFIKQGRTRKPNWKLNPHWRPFWATIIKQKHKQEIKPDQYTHLLSQKEISRIFTALNNFYIFLVTEKKVSANPMTLAWKKSKAILKQQPQEIVKRLTEIQWRYCVKAAKQLAADDPDSYEKTLFIITIFYLLYPRPLELLAYDSWTPRMNHFYKDSNQHWWFKVNNNGRLRVVAVSDDMLSALQRYRLSKGLTALPSPTDTMPLLVEIREQDTVAQQLRALMRIVHLCFDKAIEQLRENNLASEAGTMEQATVNWIRQTGISDDINKRGRPIGHVIEDAGLNAYAIINQYRDIK